MRMGTQYARVGCDGRAGDDHCRRHRMRAEAAAAN